MKKEEDNKPSLTLETRLQEIFIEAVYKKYNFSPVVEEGLIHWKISELVRKKIEPKIMKRAILLYVREEDSIRGLDMIRALSSLYINKAQIEFSTSFAWLYEE